tara:strand:+ start:10172 stop:11011 length:840 start_codon:yes stop_codon:yes gene_type:complete
MTNFKKVAAATLTGAVVLMSGTGVKAGGSGTGFFVNPNGYIVTNNHVAIGTLRFKDGTQIPFPCRSITAKIGHTTYRAKLLARDKQNDLALLKIDLGEQKQRHFVALKSNQSVNGWTNLGGVLGLQTGISNGHNRISNSSFSYVRLAKNQVTHGDIVHVFGYPLGNFISSQMKIATGAVNATMGFDDNSSRFQHDAAAYPGNSGSPVMDKAGNLVGVHVSGAGINTRLKFAIKGNVLKEFLKLNDVPFDEVQNDTPVSAQELYRQAKHYITYMNCYDYH